MSFQCGIVGLSNVGKSTLFEGLTGIQNKAANYFFSTIEPNQALVPVPDPRLNALANLVKPHNTIPTTVEFVDIAGLVKGASQGEGLGNQFLSHIREVDALIHVVRCFKDPEVMHLSNHVDPIEDVSVIHTELALSDLDRVEKALKRYEKSLKSNNKDAKLMIDLLKEAKAHLDQGLLLRQIQWESSDLAHLQALQLLTIKPMLYLANVDEQSDLNHDGLKALQEQAALENTQVIPSCVKLEAELVTASYNEKQDLLNLLGYEKTSLEQLIHSGYQLLDLQTFFTAGPQEVRAWTVKKQATAFDAAGRIHTDFQKGFIRAEVIAYEDFIQHQGEQGAKHAGKWRLEGKLYVLQDGDILHFRFNV